MIKFYVTGRLNPITKTTKFYAQMASPESVDINTVANRIAANCTLTRHDILACLSAFQEQLINNLQDGKSVRLPDLGSFRVTLHSEGADSKESFSSSHIKGASVRFVPSARLRKATAIHTDGMNLSFVEHHEAPVPPAHQSPDSKAM